MSRCDAKQIQLYLTKGKQVLIEGEGDVGHQNIFDGIIARRIESGASSKAKCEEREIEGLSLILKILYSGREYKKEITMNKQIMLGEQSGQIVEKLIAEGAVQSADEAIEEGLRLLEKREVKREALRQELQKGIDSGRAENFSLENLLDTLNRQRR